MNWPLSYKEAQFSPGEVTACTGLSLAMQRDWRSHGYLRPRTTGHARFSPREVAELRVMVLVRGRGVSLSESHSVAERAASSVLYIAVSQYRQMSLAVDADLERGGRYLDVLEKQMDEQLFYSISGADSGFYRYILEQGSECKLLPNLEHDAINNRVEASTFISLEAVAAALVEAAPRPLFTLVVPAGFK